MEKLKPCPFCGKKAILKAVTKSYGFTIWCACECGARTEGFCPDTNKEDDTIENIEECKKRAIKAWNRRQTMRLIDADKLIGEMRKWYWDNEKQKAAEKDNSPMDLFTNLAIKTVKEQPTAYDVDTVVEQIKMIAIPVLDEDEHVVPESNIHEACEIEMVALLNAIEIVKGGGVNEC